jgi:hypothetical protein
MNPNGRPSQSLPITLYVNANKGFEKFYDIIPDISRIVEKII